METPKDVYVHIEKDSSDLEKHGTRYDQECTERSLCSEPVCNYILVNVLTSVVKTQEMQTPHIPNQFLVLYIMEVTKFGLEIVVQCYTQKLH